MIEPAHITISNVLNEVTHSYEDLRIIAKDNRDLSASERERISIAADELEFSYRNFAILYAELVEAKARLVAVNERPWLTLRSPLEARFSK
jgi:hypothetical protein